eukprot:s5718_g1.t1
MVTFKESKWIGSWCGYFYTSIEHSGKHVTGYKLDIATEAKDFFAGPRAHKYFGLLNGVLGYHFDSNGTPPSVDPACDQVLEKMGWGKPQVAETPPPAPAQVGETPAPAQVAETPPPAAAPSPAADVDEYEGPKDAATGMTKSLKRKAAAGESRSKKRVKE